MGGDWEVFGRTAVKYFRHLPFIQQMRSLLFFLLIPLLLMGCMKTCPENFLMEEVKPFAFKQGSYWVFLNSVTAKHDTFTVISGEFEILKNHTPVRCRGERLDEYYKMMFMGMADTFKISLSAQPYISFSSGASGHGSIFDVSISPGQCSKFADNLCSINVSSLTIGANTFTDVYQVTTTVFNINGQPLYDCDLYWVKNIGIVRAVRHDSKSTTLNIIDWNVIQ